MSELQRRPGESMVDYMARRHAIYVADGKREAERLDRWLASFVGPHRRSSADLAVGVGTFDSNGNQKGCGW